MQEGLKKTITEKVGNIRRLSSKMIIAMAADHGGFELKNKVKEHLREQKDENGENYKIVDLGTNSPESVD